MNRWAIFIRRLRRLLQQSRPRGGSGDTIIAPRLFLIPLNAISQFEGPFILPCFIDNDAPHLLVILRCLRFNPVNTVEDFEQNARQPARSLVAEIHKGCTQNRKGRS